jgi:hypothetical protein
VYERNRHYPNILYWASLNQIHNPSFYLFNVFFILSSHVQLGLKIIFLFKKIWLHFPSLPVYNGCFAQLIFPNLTTLIIFVGEYRFWRAPLYGITSVLTHYKAKKLWNSLYLLSRMYLTQQGIVLWDLLQDSVHCWLCIRFAGVRSWEPDQKMTSVNASERYLHLSWYRSLDRC